MTGVTRKFIHSDGTIEMRDIGDLHHTFGPAEPGYRGPYKKIVVSYDAPAKNGFESRGPEVAKMARAMFDRAFTAEAKVKGEGNTARALDIMWSKTKLDAKSHFMDEARAILSSMKPADKTFMLHGDMYIELGTVFVDPTPKSADAEFEKNLAEARQQQLFAQGNPPPTFYGVERSQYVPAVARVQKRLGIGPIQGMYPKEDE